jgi:subfamily B ATP-binding cassette protein MsbA
MPNKKTLQPRDDIAHPKFAATATLFSLALPEKSILSAAGLCAAISALATAGYAYLVGPVIRSLFLGNDPVKLPISDIDSLQALSTTIGSAHPMLIGAAIVTAAIIKGAAQFGHTALIGKAGQRVLHRLRARLYHGLLGTNPVDIGVPTRGELVSRFTVDLEAVEKAISQGLFAIARDAAQILALAGLAIALDPLLGLVGLVAFPPVAVFIVRTGKRLRTRSAEVHQAFGDISAAVDETVSGLMVIQSFGAEKLMENRFIKRSRFLSNSSFKTILLKAASSPVNELLGSAALALTLWYAHNRISEGALSPEAFISFFSALFLLYQPVKGIGQAGHAIESGLAALDRLAFVTTFNRPGKVETASIQSASEVCLKAVEVGYGDGASVLKGMDLTIEAGSKTAVIGRSGAGKTTVLNLLQGFLPLRSGQLLADGQSIDPNPLIMRSIFAPVPQEPYLFDDTIKMNVLCGRAGASDVEIEKVCAAAGVSLFVDDFPQGLATRVGPGGKALSLGQRQRVCLARALLSSAPILLFDEVTASLDGETEQALVDGLKDFLGNRTVIVVTHRLTTARWADHVALLENGAIQVLGSIDTMFEPGSRLARLFGDQPSL